MNWRQPIPTGIDEEFGKDRLCNLLYRELIYRAANKDGFFTDRQKRSVGIRRGQVVFGRRAYHDYLARDTNDDGKKVERSLKKLCDFYKKVTLEVTHQKHTIVTLLDYDIITSFDPENDPPMTHQRPTDDPPVTTSKSVKSVKSVKNRKGSLDYLTDEVCAEVAAMYGVKDSDVRRRKESLVLYCQSKGKRYSDYYATLQTWVRKDIDEGRILKIDVHKEEKRKPLGRFGDFTYYTQKELDDHISGM